MKRHAAFALVLATAWLAAAHADEPAPSFEKRLQEVLPSASEERWLRVEWRTDLAQARIEANDSGKPIFLWIMDGDPLGCT